MNEILEKSGIDVIKENYNKLFSAEKKVADFVLRHPQEVVNMNVSELAKSSEVSVATVVRACHHMGYEGYYQFRIMLARETGRKQRQPVMTPVETDDVVGLFQKYANDILAIGNNIDQEAIWACVNLIKTCKQAHIVAVGNTAPLAQYMGFRLGRLGVKCTYEMTAEYFMNHVNLADADDIIIAISQSGKSELVVRAMELGLEKGLKTIAITAYRHSLVGELADYVLLSSDEEEWYDTYKSYAHLRETAVIDALLNLVTNQERIMEKSADKPEIIMSKYKLEY